MNPKLFPSALFLCVLFSCNHAKDIRVETSDTNLSKIENQASVPPSENEKKQKIPVGNLTQSMNDSVATPSQPQPATHIDWDKKIIKTAAVKLEIKDFKKYSESIHKTVRNFGGYIAQEQQNFTDEKYETVLSIKVPVDQFEPIMNEIAGSDGKMLEKTISSQDVTGEVIDTKSRLEAKKAVRLKYIDFLKASKNMEEVLKVQDEINGIQEEIEAAAGRVAFLSHQSAFSTINLSFYQPAVGFKPVDIAPSFLTRISEAFKSGSEWVANLFIGLISVWPFLLIITAAILFLKRLKYFKTNPQNQ